MHRTESEGERLMRRVRIETPSGCWMWTGAVNNNGYGTIGRAGKRGARGRMIGTHRLAYLIFVGPIPEGCELHHICERPLCCKPSHLRAVTRREHTTELTQTSNSFLNKRKTHCSRGHEYTGENTRMYRGGRRCRACGRERSMIYGRAHRDERMAYLRAWKQRQRAKAPH